MKKIKYLLLIIVLLFTTGCSFFKDTLEDSTIYTSVYPIKYLVKYLYGDYATVESIYPAGADVFNYTLTDKQISSYAESDLFIYNGLSNEKTIAKNLINKNRNLLIIDVSYGLTVNNGMKELWLSPNDYLMLAKNIKNSLIENLKSQIIIDSINKKYDELEINLSLKDAELRSIANQAKDKKKKTIVVSDDDLKFLENYGFEVISLDPDTLTESAYNIIKNDFKNKVYKTVLVLDGNETEDIKRLKTAYYANLVKVNSLTNDEATTDDDYLMNMEVFIDSIKNICLN